MISLCSFKFQRTFFKCPHEIIRLPFNWIDYVLYWRRLSRLVVAKFCISILKAFSECIFSSHKNYFLKVPIQLWIWAILSTNCEGISICCCMQNANSLNAQFWPHPKPHECFEFFRFKTIRVIQECPHPVKQTRGF